MTQTLQPDPKLLDLGISAGQLSPAQRLLLENPLARIQVTTVTRDGGQRLDCYAIDDGDMKLAAVTSGADQKVAVTLPLAPTLIEALISETLGLGQPLAELSHQSALPVEALWALAAMADAQRQIELESLLARVLLRRITLDEDTIYLRALDGATLPDPRWLSALLTHLLGPADIKESYIQRGIAALASGGFIIRSAEGLWSPQPEFAQVMAHLEIPLSGVRLAIDQRTPGGITHTALFLVRTLAAAWIITPPATNATETTLRLCAASADAVRKAVDDILKTVTSAIGPATAQKMPRAGRHCGKCGQTAAVDDNFCTACGGKLN